MTCNSQRAEEDLGPNYSCRIKQKIVFDYCQQMHNESVIFYLCTCFTLGVCACDIDGDGWEEIYVLNTNQAYAGRSSYGDKLFKWRNGKYVDLLSDKVNRNLEAKGYAGRSVACVDRHGSGKYGNCRGNVQ